MNNTTILSPRALVTNVINDVRFAGFIDSDIKGSGTVGKYRVTYELGEDGKSTTAIALRGALRALSGGLTVVTAELKYNRNVEPPIVDVWGDFSKI